MDQKQIARLWTLLFTASAIGFSSCGGDSSQVTETFGTPMSSGALPPFGEATPIPLIEPNPNHVVVVLDGTTSAQELAAELGLIIFEQTRTREGLLVRFGLPVDVTVEQIRAAEGVEAAEPNVKVTIGEGQELLLGFLEGTWNTTTVRAQPWITNLELGNLHSLGQGRGQTIAILDTGAYAAHPVLEGKITPLDPGEPFTSDEFRDHIDNDGDGEVDELFGHGTHVAGIIAIVSPQANIIPIRVLNDDGYGSLWDILNGLYLARKYGADIVNLSLSFSEYNSAFDKALESLSLDGIVTVVAAGNYGPEEARFPATSDHAVGVASVSDTDVISRFSCAGDQIMFAAPGEAILSSYPRAELWAGTGTSMAAPIVAGSIACVCEARAIGAKLAVSKLAATAVPVFPLDMVQVGRVSPVAAAQ